MNRRTFIRIAGAGATVAGTGGLLSACTDASNPGNDTAVRHALGVQLYTLRSQLASDVRSTLADIGAIGYKEVELFGIGGAGASGSPFFGLSANEFGKALSDAGLSAPIAHIGGDAMNIAEIAESMQEIGVRHLVVAMAPDFVAVEDGEFKLLGVTGRDQLDRIAERLNRQGELAKASGIGFGYHNHAMEFADLGDENAFDYLFSQADPDLVKIELDLGWTMVAGFDPLEVLDRYAGRIVAVHLKDFDPSRSAGDDPELYAIPIQAQIVEPGSGPSDFVPILSALDRVGVDHRFVEVDASAEPLAAVARGYRYLDGLMKGGA